MGCDGNCRRMKNYDEKVKLEKEKKYERKDVRTSI